MFLGTTCLKSMYDFISKKYGNTSQASQMEGSETLLSHESDEGYRKLSKWPMRHYTIGISFLLSCIFACLAGYQIGSYSLHDVDSLCTQHVSQYCMSTLKATLNSG